MRKLTSAIVMALLLTCGTSYGQNFIGIMPSDLGFTFGANPSNAINGTFNIGTVLGESADAVTLTISNGYVAAGNDSWTVSETESTGFVLGGTTDVRGFVNHGANLGSPSFAGQTGSAPRDGISSAIGEDWSFVSTLDADYQDGQTGDMYFVDYIGADTGNLESNGEGFRWEADGDTNSFGVFSQNTTALNNNYAFGFATIAAIPEPTSGILAAFATGVVLLRRRRRC